MNILDILRNNI